jgi:tetratricopeptide (TPR) repeat protein
MDFRILGPLEIRRADCVVRLGCREERAIALRLLLAGGQPVPPARLVDDLWRGERTPDAELRLAHHVQHLQQVLEPGRPADTAGGVLVRDAAGYRLSVAPDEVDATRFAALVAEGRAALEKDDPERAEERFRTALAMWRGDPLGDLAGEPFARAEAARLQSLWHAAALGHAEAVLDLGIPRAAAAELERLLEVIGRSIGHEPRELEAGPPLVGRQRELAQLERLLDEALSGERRVALVAGEAGVGKSRLVAELTSLAGSAGALVAVGHAYPGQGAPPYWPWAQALRALVTSVPEETVAAAFASGGSVVARLVPEVGPILPRTRDETESLPASTARARLAEVVTRGLASIAARLPVVLVLEDLHRADPASLFLLRYLAAAPPVGSLLVVGTYRTRELESEVARTLSALRSHRCLAWLELSGLGEADVAELLGALGLAGRRGGEVAAIGERTGGNPFLIEETTHMLRRASVDSLAQLPTDAVGLVQRNIAALPPATRRLLEVAAVMGEHLDLRVLEPVLGDAARSVVPAVESRVLVAIEESGQSFRFRHELLRTAIYEQMDPARCAELHGAVGTVLRDSANRPADEVAEHLWRAAVDCDGSDYADQAVGATLAAADAALDMSSIEQAQDHLERATALLAAEARPEIRGAREVQVGARWVRLHELDKGPLAPEIAAAVRRVWGTARGPAVGDEMAATGRAGWTHHVLRGELTPARALAQDLVRRGTEGAEASSLAVGFIGLGHIHFLSGKPGAALVALERGLETAEADEQSSELLRRERVRARAYLVPVLEVLGESSRSRGMLDAGLACAARPDDTVELRLLAAVAGVVAGDPRRAIVNAREAEDVARSCSLGLYVPLARALRAWAAVRLGDPSAEWGLAEAQHQLDAMDFRWLRALRLGLQAEATATARGALEAGLEHLDNALGEAETTGEHLYEPELHRLRAELLAAMGRSADAEQALARALDSAQATGASALQARVHTTTRSLGLHTAR